MGKLRGQSDRERASSTSSLTPKLGLLSLDQPWDSYAHQAMGSAGFTVIANVSGQPAISLPLGQSDDGLPVGMMFTARLGGEDGRIKRSSPAGSMATRWWRG